MLLFPAIPRKASHEIFGRIREQLLDRDNHEVLRNSEMILIVSVPGEGATATSRRRVLGKREAS